MPNKFKMINPKSLQQRLSLFMILPVALLLIGMGIAGFNYSREALLSQWQEAAVLKLQRGAHLVNMHLSRIRNWIHSLDKAAESSNPDIIFKWVTEQLKAQEGVVRLELTWQDNTANDTMPIKPGMMGPGSAMGPSMGGSREDRAEMMRHMRRFHRTRIGDITTPRFDALIKNQTVSLVSDLLDKNDQILGRLAVVLSFEYLVKNVVTSSWWQSNEGFLVDDHGKILKRVGATQIIHPERDMAVRISRGLSRPNVLDFIPLADEYDLIQADPPREFIGKSLRALNLRAKFNVHVIAIKELVPENFTLVPPADFVIKDSDILIILGKTEDIRKIKALK